MSRTPEAWQQIAWGEAPRREPQAEPQVNQAPPDSQRVRITSRRFQATEMCRAQSHIQYLSLFSFLPLFSLWSCSFAALETLMWNGGPRRTNQKPECPVKHLRACLEYCNLHRLLSR